VVVFPIPSAVVVFGVQ